MTLTPTTYGTAPRNLCVNCHRRDVYGDLDHTAPAYYAYARQEHPIDMGKNHSLESGYVSKWGIPCMNCHGGARIGGIHGSNLGKGAGGSGGSYSGKRLLNGSNWYAVTRSTTAAAGQCWTKGSADAVDNCAHSHGGVDFLSGDSDRIGSGGGVSTAGQATYDYDSNP